MKKFLILNNLSSVLYKEIFPRIKQGEIKIGISNTIGDLKFIVPNDYSLYAYSCGVDNDNNKYVRICCRWLTNINTSHTEKPLPLTKTYNKEDYPKYDNYNAINVNKVKDIPYDYDDLIGVPISFLDKNSAKYEIIDKLNNPILNGKHLFKRIIIRRKI